MHALQMHTVLMHTVLMYTVLMHTVLMHTVLMHRVAMHTVAMHTVLMHTVLMHTLLMHRVLMSAPMTCRPNAAQSVVPGGLSANTRETVSPSPMGGGAPCREWSRRSASPPYPSPGGIPSARGAGVRACCVGPGDNGEETKSTTAAMMLSRLGRDRDPPCRSNAGLMRAGRHHGVVWRVRPTRGPHFLPLLMHRVLMCTRCSCTQCSCTE